MSPCKCTPVTRGLPGKHGRSAPPQRDHVQGKRRPEAAAPSRSPRSAPRAPGSGAPQGRARTSLSPAPRSGSRGPGTRAASPPAGRRLMPDSSPRCPRAPGRPGGDTCTTRSGQAPPRFKVYLWLSRRPPARWLRNPGAREASEPGNRPLPAQLSPPPAGSFHFLTAKSPRGAPLPPPPLRPPARGLRPAPRRARPRPARAGPAHPDTFGL